MALTGWSTSNYLSRAANVAGARPFMLSVWARHPDTGTVSAPMVSIDDGTFAERHLLGYNGFVSPRAIDANDTAADNASFAQAITVPNDTWYHASGCFVSATLREARVNGGGLATNATSRTPSGLTQTQVGKSGPSAAFFNTSGLAEASIWDLTGFSEANRTSLAGKLAAGENPIAINAETGQSWTGMLTAYWRLANASDITDLSGNGHNLTMSGTLTAYATHPAVDDPPSTDPVTPIEAVRYLAQEALQAEIIDCILLTDVTTDPWTATYVSEITADEASHASYDRVVTSGWTVAITAGVAYADVNATAFADLDPSVIPEVVVYAIRGASDASSRILAVYDIRAIAEEDRTPDVDGLTIQPGTDGLLKITVTP